MSRFLDVSSTAEFFGMTEKGIRKRVERRMIPFRKWGGRIVFVKEELEKFVDSLPGCSLDEAQINEEKKRG